MSKESVSILLANHKLPDINQIKSVLSANDHFDYFIDTADSGVVTLKKSAENNFDIILLNQNMPGFDSLDMLEELTAKKTNTPVIMMVESGGEKFGIQSMEKGAYDYLTAEEIGTGALNRAIRRTIQRKKLEGDIKGSLARMEKLAIKDGLTGLYNHNHLREELNKEYKKAQRHLQPLSCIILDLDHFKSVNDRHGHQFGNYVLTRSARILTRLVRDTDFVARFGGEEFFIILPNTYLKGAYILAERIRVAFANNLFKKGKDSTNVTVSLGISSMSDGNILNDEGLIANADRALYRAKWRGRNNVSTYEESEGSNIDYVLEEVKKVEDFHSRFQNINEKIKGNCIESAHEIFLEIEHGWDYINKHSIRVSRYVEKLAKGLLMSEDETEVVKRAALLHDIGMVGISSDIVRKKEKLTDEEYGLIKRHSNIGVKIVEKTRMFEKELPIILYHHERFDGKGYPHKLKGDTIPYGARMLAISEAFDAMKSRTAYKKAGSTDGAIAELQEHAGTQFDPHMVDVFVKMISKDAVTS